MWGSKKDLKKSMATSGLVIQETAISVPLVKNHNMR